MGKKLSVLFQQSSDGHFRSKLQTEITMPQRRQTLQCFLHSHCRRCHLISCHCCDCFCCNHSLIPRKHWLHDLQLQCYSREHVIQAPYQQCKLQNHAVIDTCLEESYSTVWIWHLWSFFEKANDKSNHNWNNFCHMSGNPYLVYSRNSVRIVYVLWEIWVKRFRYNCYIVCGNWQVANNFVLCYRISCFSYGEEEYWWSIVITYHNVNN